MKKWKLKNFVFLLAVACIAGIEFAFHGTLYSLAAVPVHGLYTDDNQSPGRVYQNHPNTNIRSLVCEVTDIPFGHLVKLGTDPVGQCAIFDNPAATIAGVALWAADASDIENEKYLDGDVVGVLDNGIVIVYSEEAVTPGSPVRVRHTLPGTPTADQKLGAFLTTAAAGQTALLSGFEFRGTLTGPGFVPVAVTKASFGAVAD